MRVASSLLASASVLLLAPPAVGAPWAVVTGPTSVSGDPGQVRAIDLATNSVVSPSPAITLGIQNQLYGLNNIAIAPDDVTVAVAESGNVSILTLDPGTGNLTDSGVDVPNPGDGTTQIAFTEDGQRLLVTTRNAGVVQIVDTATWTVLSELACGGTAHGVAAHPDGVRAVYTSFSGPDRFGTVDLEPAAACGAFIDGTGSTMEGLAITLDGGLAAASGNNADSQAEFWDFVTDTFHAVTLAKVASSVAISRDGTIGYFGDDVDSITRVDLTARPPVELDSFVVSGNDPFSLATTAEGLLLSAGNGSQSVAVFDLATTPPTQTATIALGFGVTSVAVQGGLYDGTPIIGVPMRRPFDFARVPTTTPELRWRGSDPQAEDIRYELQWSPDPAFATFESRTSDLDVGFTNLEDALDIDPFTSGQTIAYTIPLATLATGTTYWWRVRGLDPAGTNRLGGWSRYRSFTVDTALTDTAWLQRTARQFETNRLTDTAVAGALIRLADVPQTWGPSSPSSETGVWTDGGLALADGGGFATTSTLDASHTFSSLGLTTHGGITINGIVVETDAWNPADGNARIGVQLSWDGGITWTAEQETGNLPSTEPATPQTLGGTTNLWGRASWNATELANANFRLRVFARKQGGAGTPTWNLDWVRATIHFTGHRDSGTVVTRPLRNSELALTNGGASWATITWTKNLPAGCVAPDCDVTLDVLDESGVPIPGYIGFTGTSADIRSLDPAIYPVIRLRANLLAASPSPELTSLQVDTVGGTPLSATVTGLRARRSGEDVLVTWNADPTSGALAFEVVRGPSESGPFVPLGSPVEAVDGIEAYQFRDPHTPDTPWYALDVDFLDGHVERLGPVTVDPNASSPAGGCGCSFVPARGGLAGMLLALGLALAAHVRTRASAVKPFR